MSSPASSPESEPLPPSDDAAPPSSLPIPPIPAIVSPPPASSPVDSPETAPLISPPPPAVSINPPTTTPTLPDIPPPTTPALPHNPPVPELPNIPPPAPELPKSPPPPTTTPALPNIPPPTTPALPQNPTAPALTNIPPPAPEIPKSPPPPTTTTPALPNIPPHTTPALPKKSPAPALTNNPPLPTKPHPPSSSVPVNPTPPASPPPATTKPPFRRSHSSKTKLPSTAPIPASQPPTGGGSPEVMPLTEEMPAPAPSVGLEVGGGSRPAMAVLPVGANGSSDLQAGMAGGGGGGKAADGVSTGIVAGLCFGGVVLVVLLVFGILLVVCRRKKGCGDDDDGDCGASFACNSKADFQGNLSLPSYTKRHTSFPETQIWGATNNNNGSGSANSGSTTGLVSVPLAVPSSGTFTYEELVAATNGFSEPNLLGQGGFGYVHKGVLPNGKEVAVKKLKMGGQQGEREFRAEVDTISQVHHKHLVSLVGYCISGVERLLVYEFVANKTMEFHLHEKDQPVMDWSTRLKIAIGSAKGLAYLHEDCNPTIIHRDIKAANILLDFNYEVKVADFGLAKIFSNTNSSVTHITTRVVGTFGYLAPEYASSGKVTDKSDVYSYGVMLLELITGRPPINTSESAMNGSLVNWARPLLPQAIEDGNFDTLVDPRLKNSYKVDEMANMVACAAACVRLSAWRRPRMSQVIRALEGDLSPSDLDDGVRPGHSSMHFPYESLDFDARKYMEDMRKLRMTLSSNAQVDNTIGRYSKNTSEYGLQPSISSADSHELYTRSFEPGRD